MSTEAEMSYEPDFLPEEEVQSEPEKEVTRHEETPVASPKAELSYLMDVPLKVSVELGRGDITLRELLLIGQSTVIELDKLAGEPLEVLVNDKLVSKGEVVVINEKYGIRLTDIIDPVAQGRDPVQT